MNCLTGAAARLSLVKSDHPMPTSLDVVGDSLESIADAPDPVTDGGRRRRVFPLETLAPVFAMFADATGKSIGPELMHVYSRYFADMQLSPASVERAAAEIVVGWDKPYWPTAETVGHVARRLQRDTGTAAGAAAAEHDRAAELSARDWDARVAIAETWFDAHRDDGAALLAAIDRQIAAYVAAHPTGWLANPKTRKAYRHGELVSACLRQAAIGTTPAGRTELDAVRRANATAAANAAVVRSIPSHPTTP